MAIKQRIKIKNDRVRGTSPAALRSSGPKHSAERPASTPGVSGESARRGVPTDDKEPELHEIDRPRFEEHSDDSYQAHLKNFFKVDES